MSLKPERSARRLNGVCDCPMCSGIGKRYRTATQVAPPSLAEQFHITLSHAEGRPVEVVACKLCSGAGKLTEADAGAYRMVGLDAIALNTVYAYP